MPATALPAAQTDWLRTERIREVELIFADLTGFPRGKTLPAAAFGQGQEVRIARAVAIQGCTGEFPDYRFYGEHDPDVTLRPDPATLRRAPWSGGARAVAICDNVDHDGRLSPLAPRSVLKQVLAGYAARGLAPVVAPELEFYLFATHDGGATPFRPPTLRSGRCETGGDAFSLSARNDLDPFFDEVYRGCDELGIVTDTFVHEMGPSQFEINLRHGEALRLADHTFLFKYLLKETAHRHGLSAVCMAKPLAGEPGSSMHLHQSLVDAQGRNVFSRPDGSASPLFRHFIAGLQRHLPALLPLFCPSPNSYRRFVKGLAAPVNLSWGEDNRSVGLRVPHGEPAARRVENRLPGADANPYLALAASLGAGLLGLTERLEPEAAAVGNVFKQGEASLPATLDAALAAMAAAPSAWQLFGEEFVRAYLAVKELELADYHQQVTPWERRHLGLLA
ncbi:glutamine synthetase family protein [Pseudogulbenkiania sp. MAI-1]|uniref:glutamine synthetase family protein n=1 Tax=Pseudogulbenkiania sp. MAI-1 TaxID=990370 RepID=UPI00045EA382|nr:glutamine synthetase family protein [Pseudogulbenkiania sp. MAI-1]